MQINMQAALAEFERLSGGAFTPSGRCTANRAFTETVQGILEGKFNLPDQPPAPTFNEGRGLRPQTRKDFLDSLTGA